MTRSASLPPLVVDTALASATRAFSSSAAVPSFRSISAVALLVVCPIGSGSVRSQASSGVLLNASWIAQASPEAFREFRHEGTDIVERGAHGLTALESAGGQADRRVLALALASSSVDYDALDGTVRGLLRLESMSETLAEVPVKPLLGRDWAATALTDGLRSLPTFGDGRDKALDAADLRALLGQAIKPGRDPAMALFLTKRDTELGFGEGVHALHLAARNTNLYVARALLDLKDPEVRVDETDGVPRAEFHSSASNKMGWTAPGAALAFLRVSVVPVVAGPPCNFWFRPVPGGRRT